MGERSAEMTDAPKSTSLPPDTQKEIQTQANHDADDSDQAKIEHLTAQLEEVTALHNIGLTLNSSLNPKEVIWALYKETNRLVDTSNFALVLHDYQHQALKFMLIFDQGQQVEPFSTEISDNPELTGYVLTTQSPLMIRNLADSDKKFEFNNLSPDKPIRSWLGVPIVDPVQAGQPAQGVIALWSYEPHAFNSHQVWLLSAIGTHASIALRNARLFESSQRRTAEMSRLNELARHRAEEMAQLKDMAQRKAEEMALINGVARILSASLNLDTVLTKIMEQVDDMLAVEAGSLLLVDSATGDLVFQIALGDTAAAVKPFRLPRGQGIAGRVAQTGKPLVIADARRDRRHFKAPDEKSNFTTRDMLCVPLIFQERVIGVLEVMNKTVGDFNQSDVDLLTAIASYAAIAIENARLYESLEAEHNRTIIAEQEARKKLAGDLHDGPTQLLAAIMMNLDFASKALEKDPSLLPNTIVEMQELASQASHQMRTLLFQLRPLVLEKQGLGAALKVFLDRRQKEIVEDQNTKISFRIETDDPSGDIARQDGKIEMTIFTIVREAVNNAVKHAKADNIIVELKETPAGVETVITDDGVGFDVDEVMRNYETSGSLGMINLRERAQSIGGKFTLQSQNERGTRIALFVPDEKVEKAT